MTGVSKRQCYRDFLYSSSASLAYCGKRLPGARSIKDHPQSVSLSKLIRSSTNMAINNGLFNNTHKHAHAHTQKEKKYTYRDTRTYIYLQGGPQTSTHFSLLIFSFHFHVSC